MEMRRLNRRILTQFIQDQKDSAQEKKIRDFDFGASEDLRLDSPRFGENNMKFEEEPKGPKIGSEQRAREIDCGDTDMKIELNKAYPQCKTTFAEKIRISLLYA